MQDVARDVPAMQKVVEKTFSANEVFRSIETGIREVVYDDYYVFQNLFKLRDAISVLDTILLEGKVDKAYKSKLGEVKTILVGYFNEDVERLADEVCSEGGIGSYLTYE